MPLKIKLFRNEVLRNPEQILMDKAIQQYNMNAPSGWDVPVLFVKHSPSEATVQEVWKVVTGILTGSHDEHRLMEIQSHVHLLLGHEIPITMEVACDALAVAVETELVPKGSISILHNLVESLGQQCVSVQLCGALGLKQLDVQSDDETRATELDATNDTCHSQPELVVEQNFRPSNIDQIDNADADHMCEDGEGSGFQVRCPEKQATAPERFDFNKAFPTLISDEKMQALVQRKARDEALRDERLAERLAEKKQEAARMAREAAEKREAKKQEAARIAREAAEKREAERRAREDARRRVKTQTARAPDKMSKDPAPEMFDFNKAFPALISDEKIQALVQRKARDEALRDERLAERLAEKKQEAREAAEKREAKKQEAARIAREAAEKREAERRAREDARRRAKTQTARAPDKAPKSTGACHGRKQESQSLQTSLRSVARASVGEMVLPQAGGRVHFSGCLMWDEQVSEHCSIPYTEDQHSEYVGEGRYSSNMKAFPKAIRSTFDAVAVDAGTRVTIYSEQNFKGKVLWDRVGPALVCNSIWKDHQHKRFKGKKYSEVFTQDWEGPLQAVFPQEVREFSTSDMHRWNTGSLVIQGGQSIPAELDAIDEYKMLANRRH